MEDKKQEDKNNLNSNDVVVKCSSCGAGLSENLKKCEYCGSINPNFKPKELKTNSKQLLEKQKKMFGGLFGNVFDEILNNIDEE